tara:strand:+ start:610 stop:828 length:219 start_codon:yes stop_codon:yes gene_type:complete
MDLIAITLISSGIFILFLAPTVIKKKIHERHMKRLLEEYADSYNNRSTTSSPKESLPNNVIDIEEYRRRKRA